MAKKISDKEYKRRARALNRLLHLGINHSTLSTANKAKITRAYEKHREYIADPGAFEKIRLTGRRKELLEQGGYVTTKTRAYIPKYDANKVRVKGNIIQHLYADKWTETPIGNLEDIMEQFRDVFDKKKKGQFVAASFGGNGLFKSRTFDSYQSFYLYMEGFKPADSKNSSDKKKREDKQALIAHLKLVTLPKSARKRLKTPLHKKAIPISEAMQGFRKRKK